MRNKAVSILAFLVLLVMSSTAFATLEVIGTATYQGNSYNLIWSDNNNGNSVVWLDYTNSPGTWGEQTTWASGLDAQLTYHINSEYSVTWIDNDWRLPTTIDGSEGYSCDGSTTYGHYFTNSEMGHLYYRELNNIGQKHKVGSNCIINSSFAPLRNVGPFQHLTAEWYMSATKSTTVALLDSPWIFHFGTGLQYSLKLISPTININVYGLALRTGTVVKTSQSPPTVTTQAVTNVGTTSATGNGTITGLGSPNPTDHGFCWNTTGSPTIGDNAVPLGAVSATGAFSASITNLSPNTTYYIRAFASNKANEEDEARTADTGTGISYGNEVSFTTDSDPAPPQYPPTISTQPATGISSDTATGHGTITTLGNPTPARYGICWTNSGTPTTADHVISSGPATATGAFSFTLTGLTPNTTYHVRFYATSSAGTVYGGQISFTTLAAAIPTMNEWGMIIFALLLLGMGYTIIRKQDV